MVGKTFLALMVLVLAAPILVCAHWEVRHPAEVRVLSDKGGEFAQYRTYPHVSKEGTYFYVEAVKGERYSIAVRNISEGRIGVVIAVDGRNIINGEKSDLKLTERMYIIAPHSTNTFEGWRTGMDRTNRFFFTEQSDSYAEKVFSDASAMGTIAVAVYREKESPVARRPEALSKKRDASASLAPQASAEHRSADKALQDKSEQAGTGFGETAYSPVRVVEFEPERTAAEKIVLKYEWRSELCKKGIASCGPQNRFWPDNRGFAPVPKDFRG